MAAPCIPIPPIPWPKIPKPLVLDIPLPEIKFDLEANVCCILPIGINLDLLGPIPIPINPAFLAPLEQAEQELQVIVANIPLDCPFQ